MPCTPLTCPSPVDILDEPRATVPATWADAMGSRGRTRRAIVDAVTT